MMRFRFRTSAARKVRAAVLMTLGTLGAVNAASAAVVSSGPVNISIPDSLDGVLLNVITGETSTAELYAPAGWDINPYSTLGGGTFNLWGPPSFPTYLHIVGNYNLPMGTLIEGDERYFFTPASLDLSSQINLNSDANLFGFRFLNEDGGTIHYGWVQVGFGATAADRYIASYAYESTPGVGIPAGVVPEPASLALVGVALLGLQRRRSMCA